MTELAEAISKIESLISIENRDFYGVLKILQSVHVVQGEAAKAADGLYYWVDRLGSYRQAAITAVDVLRSVAQIGRAPVAELGAFEKDLCDAVSSGLDKSFAELSENYRNMLRANQAPTWVVKEPGVRVLTDTSFSMRIDMSFGNPTANTYLGAERLDGPFFSAADAEKAVANYINTNRETLVAFGFIPKE